MRLNMSPAAAGVARALIFRSGAERNRILLTEVSSTDWQSLTFSGERHRLALRIVGADSHEIAERLSSGLEDAELNVPGAIVADIALVGDLKTNEAATELLVEALTIVDD